MDSFQFSKPSPRREVQNMEAYQAPLEGRRKLLRLDFNENTVGPSPKVIEAIRNFTAEKISIYPEYNGLREAFINNLKDQGLTIDLKPSEIGIFNGVDAAINAIFHAFGDRGNTVLTTVPTFGYYTPCAQMQGMKIKSIEYEGTNFQFPLEQIKENLIEENPKLLLICNPNNPTGTRLEASQIIELATSSPSTLVVIDELYEAFTGDSALPLIDVSLNSNLIILRSLSKTAGLAGLRIGFAIGNKYLIEAIKRVTGPYDVNSFAVSAAIAALDDQRYIDNYVSEVLNARDWIKMKLIDNRIKHHIDGGNYMLIWPNGECSDVEKLLKEMGILIRNMDKKPCLKGALRVSIGTKKQMQTFWKALKNIENI